MNNSITSVRTTVHVFREVWRSFNTTTYNYAYAAYFRL